MKEQIENSVYQKSIVRLTNEAKKPYSKSGDIFMAEGGEGPGITSKEIDFKQPEQNEPQAAKIEGQTLPIKPGVKKSNSLKPELLAPKPQTESNFTAELKPKMVYPEELQINLEHYARNHGRKVKDLTYGERETIKIMLESGQAGSMTPPPSETEKYPDLDPGEIKDLGIKFLLKKYNRLKEDPRLYSVEEVGKLEGQFLDRCTEVMANLAAELEAQGKTPEEIEIEKNKLEDQLIEINIKFSNVVKDLKEEEFEKQQRELDERRKKAAEETNEERRKELEEEIARRPEYQALDLRRRANELFGPGSIITGKERKEAEAVLHKDIVDFIDKQESILTAHFPSAVLGAVRYYKDLRERFISEILFFSYNDKTETNPYEIGLYARSNLDVLLGYLERDDPSEFQKFFSLTTAANFFQTMNAGILTGNLENFSRVAESINIKHFDGMKEVKGVGLVERLFEEEYQGTLAKSKRILEEDYENIREKVKERLIEMNQRGLIISPYEKKRKEYMEDLPSEKRESGYRAFVMENWEIERALGGGRAFFNIKLRAGEKISEGQLPEVVLRSFPQEDIVRILNWNEWFLKRFQFAEGKHGQEFLGMVLERWRKFLVYKGRKLGLNKLEEFGGLNVKSMENAAQFNTSGFQSGWRNELMTFGEIKIKLGKEEITIEEYLKTTEEYLDRTTGKTVGWKVVQNRIRDRLKNNPKKDPKDLVTGEDQREYLSYFKPLIDRLDIGLGILIKNGKVGDQGKLGYLVRKEIWEKASRTNMPLMINYLTGLKFDEGILKTKKITTPPAKSMEEIMEDVIRPRIIGRIRRRPGMTDEEFEKKVKGIVKKESEKRINNLRDKAILHHEKKVRRAMGDKNMSKVRLKNYSKEEKLILDKIITEGMKIAPDLADIIFPHTPFMNDVPFEDVRYVKLGQASYKRRTGGDLGGYNKGQGAYAKVLDNPGGQGLEAFSKGVREIVDGIQGPEGDKAAWDSVFPILESAVDISKTDSSKELELVKSTFQALRKPTSTAQRWAGMEADSLSRGELTNWIEKLRKDGNIGQELANYMRKRKNLTVLWLALFVILNLTPIATYSAGKEFGKSFRKAA